MTTHQLAILKLIRQTDLSHLDPALTAELDQAITQLENWANMKKTPHHLQYRLDEINRLITKGYENWDKTDFSSIGFLLGVLAGLLQSELDDEN